MTDGSIFEKFDVAISAVERSQGRGQIVPVTGNGVALDEEPSFIGVGHEPLSRNGRRRQRHAFDAGTDREVRADQHHEEGSQNDSGVDERNGSQLLPYRLPVQPCSNASCPVMIRSFRGVRGHANRRNFRHVLFGPNATFGHQAICHILKRTHATLLSLSFVLSGSPIGLPRCCVISSDGIALK